MRDFRLILVISTKISKIFYKFSIFYRVNPRSRNPPPSKKEDLKN